MQQTKPLRNWPRREMAPVIPGLHQIIVRDLKEASVGQDTRIALGRQTRQEALGLNVEEVTDCIESDW